MLSRMANSWASEERSCSLNRMCSKTGVCVIHIKADGRGLKIPQFNEECKGMQGDLQSLQYPLPFLAFNAFQQPIHNGQHVSVGSPVPQEPPCSHYLEY